MDRSKYETLLVHGRVGAGEESLENLIADEDVDQVRLESLSPAINPRADAVALRDLMRLIEAFKPDVVHSHTAKAGFLGRQAALLRGRRSSGPSPILVHTFHGHVLEGYFGSVKQSVYRTLERRLAKRTDRLIGVSSATVDDLVRLRIAPPERFSVIPLGLDLTPFVLHKGAAAAQLRREIGVADDEILASFVGRLVPIKRVDVLLRAVAVARLEGAPLRLAVAGDGELRAALVALSRELMIEDCVSWLGYRRDLPTLAAASDIAVLSSDNEGTPVSLIEAGASGLPAVSTDVGGVRDVVLNGVTGLLVPATDHERLGAAIASLAADPERRRAMGGRARDHVLSQFSIERLIGDITSLYEELATMRG